MRLMMVFLPLMLIGFESQAAQLTLNLKGVDDDQGNIRAVVCDEPTFLTHHCPYKQAIKAAPGDLTITFDNIPPGTWAVLAYHDSNMNNDLDRNMLGIPTEQFGFSNNPGFLHRPDFSESAFTMSDQNLTLDIQLSK